jgi:hypothetical protein
MDGLRFFPGELTESAGLSVFKESGGMVMKHDDTFLSMYFTKAC